MKKVLLCLLTITFLPELLSADAQNKESNLRTYDGDTEFAFALNEISAKNERFNPNLGGYHHLSQGFYPTLIQFALRVDGKIVDESIKKEKKEKPISSEKLINKILKKIQNKENHITDLTSELEKTNFSSKQGSNYNYLVNELKKAQFELNSLEKEWIDIEERMISDD